MDEMVNAPPDSSVQAKVPWRGLFALLSGTFAATLSMTFLFPATPLIMQDFGVSIEAAAWLSLSYALGATVFEPMFGRLGDIHGRKRNVVLGLLAFSLGALLAAVSPNFLVMVAARFIQGLGGAAVIPVGMAFVGEHFPEEMRGRALGLWSMINGAAPAIGPTIGGMLIDSFQWRSIYWASFGVGLVGTALVAGFMPESRRSRKEPFDYAGSVALFIAVGSLLTLLTQGRSWGWTSANCLLLAGLALIGTIAFLMQERRVSHPIVDLRFARRRDFLVPGAIVFLSFLVFQGSFFLLPFFLEQVQGYSAQQVGNISIPLFVALAAASFFAGRLSDRFRAKHLVLVGTLLTGLAIYLLTWSQVSTPFWYVLIVMASLGLGVGVTLPPLSRSVIGLAEPRKMGAVSGIFNMFRNLGGPFGTGLSATLFANRVVFRAQDTLVAAATQAGIPLRPLRDHAASIDAPGSASMGDMSTKIGELERYARTLGMAAAVGDVGWVLLGVCGIMLMAWLLLPNLMVFRRDRA